MNNELENLETLMSLREGNDKYDLLVREYHRKLETTINFITKEEFIKEEIHRVGTKFIQPITIVGANIVAEMNYSRFTKQAYESLKRGENWQLQKIIAGAKQNYLAQTGGKYFNEAEFSKAIIDNLRDGVAYLMYESFLKAELKKAPLPNDKRKKRASIPKQTQVRSLLQKEANNKCPFCISTDVDHFEIHHINNDPSFNDIANLILVCPTCHSKITKGDISERRVVEVKQLLKSGLAAHSDVLDDSFLKLFNIHKSVVIDLNTTRLATIKTTAEELALNCKLKYEEGVNFFELIYRVLHLRYKCFNNERDFSKVQKFFYDYDWMIKHYVNSFVSLIDFIYKKYLLRQNVNTYINVLNTSSMDEIRLIYYYIISRDRDEKNRLITITKALNFFDVINSSSLPLIYEQDWDEYD